MAAYQTHVEEVARRLVDAAVARGTCDIVADIARRADDADWRKSGAPESDYEKLQH